CEVDYQPGDFEIGEKDIEALNAIGQQYDMKRFAELAVDGVKKEAKIKTDYRGINDLEELKTYLKAVKKSGLVAVDLETTSLQPIGADIVGLSLCCEDNVAIYVPIGHSEDSHQLDLSDVMDVLLPVLNDVQVIGQ